MIKEQPVIDLVDVELFVAQGGFILGRSQLGIDHLGNGDEEIVWASFLGPARSVHYKRGGKRSGAGNTMEVGTLTLVLVDQGDPTDTPDMRPNVPLRVRSKATGHIIMTATTSDIDTTHTINRATGKMTTFVTIVSVDAVQQHANVNRYGAITPGGYELWENRISRLAASATAPVNVPLPDAPVVRYSL